MAFVYQGKFLNIHREKHVLPNKRKAVIEKVVHPGAVAIVAFLSRNHIVLLKQYRPVIGRFILEIPAGTLKRNERLLTCARRELKEETGYTARQWHRLASLYPVPGYSTERIILYQARQLTQREICREPDEVMKVKIYNRSEIRKLFVAKKIQDTKTLSALALCGWI